MKSEGSTTWKLPFIFIAGEYSPCDGHFFESHQKPEVIIYCVIRVVVEGYFLHVSNVSPSPAMKAEMTDSGQPKFKTLFFSFSFLPHRSCGTFTGCAEISILFFPHHRTKIIPTVC